MATATVEALYATGHWLLEQNRVRDAAEVFRAMALSAPDDERSWLALGMCHERHAQAGIASELYRIASLVAAPAIRCTIARGRILRSLGHDDLAATAFADAHEAAVEAGDDELARVATREAVQ
jgi:hypothetical protein